MEDNKKIYKGTIIYAMGNFGSRCLSFFMFPIYSYYLSTEEYGQYDLLVTTLTLLLPCFTLQIPSAIIKFMSEENKQSVVSSALAICCIGEIVLFAAGVVMMTSKGFGSVMAFWLAVKLLHEFVLQIVRGLGKNLIYSMSSILSSGVSLLGSVVLLIGLHKGINGLILASFVAEASAVVFLFLSSRMYKWIKLSAIDADIIKRMLRFALPLIPCAIIWWVMNSSDRYIIRYFMGAEYNGIYSISNKFPSIVVLVYSFYNLSWVDYIYTSSNDSAFNKIIDQFMDLLIYISIVIMYTAKLFSLYFVEAAYHSSYLYIPPLIVAMILYGMSGFWGAVYRKQNDTKRELTSSILGAAVNLLINIALIRYVGLWSAALSTTVSFFLVFGVRYKETNYYLKYDIFNKASIIRFTFVGAFSLLYYLKSLWVTVCLLALSVIIFATVNKTAICDIVQSMARRK